MAPGGRDLTDVCRMKKWTLGTKLIQEATETDIDKALEKNTTQSCGKRFYKQPKFLFYMRFFVCLFFKDPNKTTKLPEFVWILALPLTGFPFHVEDLCSLSGNHGVPTEGGSGPLGAAPPRTITSAQFAQHLPRAGSFGVFPPAPGPLRGLPTEPRGPLGQGLMTGQILDTAQQLTGC